MTNLTIPTETAGISTVKRIAYARNIDAQAIATTALIFESGHNLNNSMPMFAVFKHKTGTFDFVTVAINIGADALFVASILNLTAGNISTVVLTPVLTDYSLSGSFVVDISAGNTGASTFDVEIWGAKFI